VFATFRSAQIELLVFEFESPRTPLFVLRFPDTIEFSDLKAVIAREAGHAYNSDRDAMELYSADSTDASMPACYPLSLRYTKPSFLFARSGVSRIAKLFFNIVSGMSEAECADTLLMTLHICEDGYTVARQIKFRVKQASTIASLDEGLHVAGVIDGGRKWRYAEEWNGRMYNVYDMSDTLTHNTDPVRVEVVTEEQERLAKEKGDVLANGCSVVPDEVTQGSYEPIACPFHVPVFVGDTVAVVKERIRKGMGLESEAFDRMTIAIGDLYKPVIGVVGGLAEDRLIAKELAEKDARLYLIYGNMRQAGLAPIKAEPAARGIRIRG
jgi:hypothetical protein